MYSYSSVLVHSSIRVDVYVCVPVLSYIRMLEGPPLTYMRLNFIAFQGCRLCNQNYYVSEGKQHCRPASKLLRDWFCPSSLRKSLSRVIGR